MLAAFCVMSRPLVVSVLQWMQFLNARIACLKLVHQTEAQFGSIAVALYTTGPIWRHAFIWGAGKITYNISGNESRNKTALHHSGIRF